MLDERGLRWTNSRLSDSSPDSLGLMVVVDRRPDLQTNAVQLVDDPAGQNLDIAPRVLLNGCDDNAHDFEFVSECGHPTVPPCHNPTFPTKTSSSTWRKP